MQDKILVLKNKRAKGQKTCYFYPFSCSKRANSSYEGRFYKKTLEMEPGYKYPLHAVESGKRPI